MKPPTPSPSISRRRFLYASSLTMASTAFSAQRILGANDRIRYAVVGMGGRSKGLLKQFMTIPNLEPVAICDPDSAQMDRQLATISQIRRAAKAEGAPLPETKVDTYQDYRKLYARSDVDAVVIASTNFWHSLHAIHALQAGKHVYVEKPVSFTPWEGRQLNAAAERYGKIIVAGYQNRSDPGPQEGIRFVQEGNLGKIQKVRALCYRNRDSIGSQMDQPFKPPTTMDFDLWLGPAREHPIVRPKLHYDWHWDFNTGNGDLGNQCPHEIDMVYRLLGHPGLPTEISSFGNRFAWNDAGNTPNMITVWCQWGGADVTLEVNDLKLSPERNASPNRMGTRVGIIAECENGFLRGGRGGMVAMEKDGKTVIQKFKGNGGRNHQNAFIDAVRANDISRFPMTITQVTPAETVMHLGNASYRTGDLGNTNDVETLVAGNSDLLEIVHDQNKQLAAWGIDGPQYYCGKTILLDSGTGEVTTKGIGPELIGPSYREGFAVPQIV